MFRLSVAALIAAGVLSVNPVRAQPLDQTIDFNTIPPSERSLLDPAKRANFDEFDLLAQRADTIGAELNQDRARHIVRAARFGKIPADMTAGDVIRAWREAGADPEVKIRTDASPYSIGQDAGHFVSDVYVGTGFVCAKPGTPGLASPEIWARHFLFVTADGGLVSVEPPKCE